MKPVEFQHFAQRTIVNGAFPSDYRTAISRSYYAVYNIGISLLREMGFRIPKDSNAHTLMCKHFKKSGYDELKEAAEKIANLKAKRNHADYDLDRTDVEQKHNAKAHVYLAERIIKTLNEQCNGKNRNQIIQNMKIWRDATNQGTRSRTTVS